MPKRKGGSRKKRGGNQLANSTNAHNPANFSSNQGLVSGCAGCVGGDVQVGSLCNLPSQAAAQKSANIGTNQFMAGITGRVGKVSSKPYVNPMSGGGVRGGNTAETTFKNLQQAASDGMGFGRVPVTSVQNCSVQRASSMGAGEVARVQSGGGDNTKNCVSYFNNLGTPGYGLNVPPATKLNSLLMGSGYPAVVAYNTKKCSGGRKTRKRRRKRRKHRKHHKKRHTKRKHKRRRRHTRKRRGGSGLTKMQELMQWNQYNGLGFASQMHGGKSYKQRRKKRSGGKRKTMKGGYAQYGSNEPMTPGFASPKPGPLPWATGPLSKARQINCQDNYNHFTGKSSPSPVLDQAAPVTPFGGSGR